MAASTASACLRRLSPFVYSHNNSQAAARSGMSVYNGVNKLARGEAEQQDGIIFHLSFAIFHLPLRSSANLEDLARKDAKAQSATAFLRSFFAPLRLCEKDLPSCKAEK